MTQKIAILMTGDMGHGIGQVLIPRGYDVLTALDGRSAHTRGLAEVAGIRDAGSIEAAVAEADVILSILPPDKAVDQATAVATAMRATGAAPAFVDCNAISPLTMAAVAAALDGTGSTVIDCGIIGLNPVKTPPTRFYVSGPDCGPMLALANDVMTVEQIGDQIGQASALKMVYAAGTKGNQALQTALLMAASKLGVLDPLMSEMAYSQAGPLKAMQTRVPFIPADAGRWAPEMEEIAATFGSVGVTPHFHQGAAEVFRLLDKTPFASETRQTLDTSRTLEQALAEYVKHL